jgi:outer membrane protein TolC
MPSKRLSYLSHQHHYCILLGDLAPLINRNAIKAEFSSANARQIQAMYNYERVILNAYLEVSNQLSNIDNLEKAMI